MKSIGNKSKNIKADYNQDGSMSEIRQLTLLLDSASGLDDSMLTLEAVYTGTRGRGIGAKVKYVNRSDGRLSQVQMGDVLHSINGQMVKTCTFTAIQNILKNSFQSPVEDDFSHVSSSSTKSSVVVVALTFLHHPTPTSYNHTDSIVTDHPDVMHIRELVGTTNTLSYDNSASYHQQRWRHQNVRAVTTPSSERNLDKLENSGKRALHSQRISVPQSKLQFDSPSLHDTSQSFTKEEVLHSIFSPVPTWEEPHGNANISMSSQSRSSLQSPYNNRRSVVNLQGTHNLGHCERTPQSLETTRLRTNEERSTTTKPPRGLGKENPLESIPEYVLETSYNIMTETPSFLTTDDESKDVGGPGRHSSSLPHNTLNDFSSISDTDDPISIFLSPIDTDTKKGTTSYCDAGKSLSFSYSDTYFSPSSQACQETNSSSHDVNITLEMFDLNYVNSCSSPTKLKSIISQLSTPNKKYPELLRLAKKRLTTLQHQQTMSSLEGNSDTPLNHDYQCRQYASNKIIDNTFFTTDACSTSSGNKSYGLKSIASKSIGGSEYIDSFLSNYRTPLSEVDEDDIIPVICDKGSPLNPIKQQPELMAPVECEESLSNHSNQDYSQRKKCFTAYDAHDTSICSGSENMSCDSYHVTGVWREECQDCQRLKHEMTQMEEDLATALAAHSALSSQLTEALEEKDQLKHDLTSQISKLMNKLKSLEAVWASQKDAYCLRIASLEKAKNNAERDAIMLEEAVLETSSQAKAMKSQLLKKIQDLTLSIASEKESSSRALDTALEKQAKIHAQVEELTMKLHYRERKEVEMRRLLERDHQRKIKFAEDRSRSTLNSLSASLEETRKIVDHLTVENKELKLAIDELENERRDALEFADALTTTAALEAERAERFAAMHHDANLRALSAEKYAEAMAAKLAKKVNDLFDTSQDQDFSKRFDRGNGKNKTVDEKIPVKIEKKDTSTQSDIKASKQWFHLEEQYQQQIQELKVQSEASLREKSDEIDILLKKVKSLELDLSQNPCAFNCNSVKNEINPLRESKMVSQSYNQCNKENEVDKARCETHLSGTTNSLLGEKKNNLADSEPSSKSLSLSTVSSSRAIALRGAGGRSGLKKKLDKVRGINKIHVGGQLSSLWETVGS